MNGKVAKALRKKAIEIQVAFAKKGKAYPKVRIYRNLKKLWVRTPWNERNRHDIVFES